MVVITRVCGSGEIYMENVKERDLPIGLLAMLAVLIFSLCWFAASVSDPEWVFGANYLSDLGVSDYALANKFFNIGCLAAGAMLALCGIMIVTSKKDNMDLFAGIFALIAGIAMALIGVVTEDVETAHIIIALTAFGFGFLSLIVLSLKDRSDGLDILWVLTPLGIIAVLISYVIFNLNETMLTPEVETVAIIVLLFLFLLQGMKFIYRGRADLNRPPVAGNHRTAFGFIALIGAVHFIALGMLAILADASFTLGSDPLYLLGSSPVGEAQALFAFACVAGGFFAAIFGIGIGLMRSGLRSVGGFFAVLAGVTMIGIGITVLCEKDIYLCAEQFALAFGFIALALITANDWMKKRMMPAAFYVIILVFGIISVIAGYDSASALCILALFIVFGIEGVRMFLKE